MEQMSSLPEEVPGQRKDPSSLVQTLCLTLNLTLFSGEVYPECGVEGSPPVMSGCWFYFSSYRTQGAAECAI